MNIINALYYHDKFEGQTAYGEAIELYEAVIHTVKGDIVEVGSACGGTTIVLMAAAQEKGKMVYSVDPYPKEFEGIALEYTEGIMQDFETKFKTNILESNWNNIIQYRERLKDCIQKIPNGLSVAFIDSCHELSYVLEDIALIEKKMAAGGRIYLHDIFWEIGQVSKTQAGGLYNVIDIIKQRKNVEIFKINDISRMLRINT